MPFQPRCAVGSLLVVIVLTMLGCGGADLPLDELPTGWNRAGSRWWVEGADTSGAFRPLEDFSSMGLGTSGPVFASARGATTNQDMQREQVAQAVRRSLLPLYRNEPEIVDSLFQRHVVPELREASLDESPDALVERGKKRAYAILRRHFREPTPALRLGDDVPINYPDSLRNRSIGGAVRIQVRLNAAGEPVAMKLTDPVHPTLDLLSLHATTRMRWHPAYRLGRNDWRAVPSWARFAIHFTTSD